MRQGLRLHLTQEEAKVTYNYDDNADAWHQQLLLEEEYEEVKRMKARQQSVGSDFEPIPVGVYPVVCTSLVDLGLQAPFNPSFKTVYKIAIGFDFPTETREDGSPEKLTMILTNSMHKKGNLRKMIEGWFGKSFPSDEAANNFELKELLGKVGYANVTHNTRGEKTYANISSLIPLPKGMAPPTTDTPFLLYSEDGSQPADERSKAYAALPEWLRTKVDNQVRAEEDSGDLDDDIPF